MALTKVSLVDLNAGELILDLDADTSITSDTDDTIHFKIGGSDEITITGTALSPSTSDGNSLGTSALEWSDLFLADGAVINFGDDQDVSLTHVADTGLLLSSTDQLQFGDSGTYIHQSADGVLDLVSDTEIEINATTIDMNGALDVSGTITSGGVITGTAFTAGSAVLTEAELETLDGVTAGTAIASKVVTTDANIDTTGQRNLTISGELDAATGDFSGDVDIDGTANLDTVDIDGATQIDATVTVGVDDTGYDVKFFGATSGAYMLWDESVDDLILAGAARAVVPEGNLVLGSTAVTSTAAELNLLDGVSGLVQADLTKLAAIDATATELNIVDGGTSVGTTAFADGDGIVTNDNGTMRQTSATTLKTYVSDLTLTTAAQTNITSVGTLTALAVDNITINGNDISSTAGTDLTITPLSGQQIVLDGTIVVDAGVVTGATSVTSTAFVGNLTGTVATATQNSITTMTGLTTTGALNAGSITSGFTSIDVGAGAITTTGVITGGTVEATTDTASGDNAAMGYTAAEGLILTGQGSTNDVTIKNDADADVIEIPTGTTNVTVAGNLGIGGTAVANTDTDTSNTGNVTLDFGANQNFVLTLTGNTTLVNPSTEQVGQSGFIVCVQDGTGSRTLSVGNQYFTPGAAAVTLSTGANSIDMIPYVVQAAGKILLGTPQLAFADAS